jgi:hypothetical protein
LIVELVHGDTVFRLSQHEKFRILRLIFPLLKRVE